ncbi:MAG: hypothetical protein PVF93_00940 [Chromatiaceae bacterium]
MTATTALGHAANAPRQWVDEALQGVDEQLHPVIESHIRSQLDWRSYYLDRTMSSLQPGPSAGMQAQPSTSASDQASRPSAGQS